MKGEMFSVIYETDPPTAVTHSAFGNFIPGSGRQLATISLKTLRLYRFNPYAQYIDPIDHDLSTGLKLECVYTTELLTPVKSIGVARLPSRPTIDSLILVFDQAKVSIVYFDNSKFCIETLSLHDFEEEELRDGFKAEEVLPKVCVDPLQRCAVVLAYGRHLAVLPFIDNQFIRSYTIPLKNVDPKLNNIIDLVFLHGYYEPTLLIVYEPIQTTPGRATVRYDTVSILAVSLNVKDRVHAVVWNVGGLPTTINQCFSLPAPIGGACLFGSNEVIYLNQAVPPCGLALNSNIDEFTRFPFATETKSLCLTIDGCVVEVLNENELLIATRSGGLYLLSLNVDISNAVKQMRIQKVFDVTTPYTLTSCYPGYVFLGSKLGDSLLLHYTREFAQQGNGTQFGVNQDLSMDEDDLYLYSSGPKVANETPVVQRESSLKFFIVDRFLNTAPCKMLRVANANDVQNELSSPNNKDVFFDLITASGHEKNSSLCFFQRTIRPFVRSTVEVDNALELFTVIRPTDMLPNYVIVAMEMSTNVFISKRTMIDLMDTSEFFVHETTVLAGTLCNGEIIVQITPVNIVLVGPENNVYVDKRLLTLNINTNFPISAASIVDPYIAMITQNGRLLLYEFVSSPSLLLKKIATSNLVESVGEKASVTAVSIYKDLSGLIRICDSDDAFNSVSVEPLNKKIKVEPGTQAPQDDLDDIDAMLYGVDEKQKKMSQSPTPDLIKDGPGDKSNEFEDSIGNDVINPKTVSSSYFLLITRETGNFYIYSLPELKLVYRIKKLTELPELLIHTPMTAADYEDANHDISLGQQDYYAKQGNIGVRPEDTIIEIRLHGLGFNNSRPVLSIFVDDVVWFYEMFVYNDGQKGTLMARFRRISLSVVTRSSRFMTVQGKNPVESLRDTGRRRTFITPYDRIGDLINGLFIGGNYPSLLVSSRGEFLLHPMIIDGPIASCSAYTDSLFSSGLIYLRIDKPAIRIACLNPEIRYDVSYPVRRVEFNETVRFVVFLLRWNLFVMVTCKPVLHDKLCIVTNEDKQMETYQRDDHFVLPETDQFKLQLFSTFDWHFIPKSEIEFEEFEAITCCDEVLLNSESTLWGLQSYLAVGTAYNYGEEVFVRGRILIYEVIDVVPEEGMPTTRHRLKCVYDKEQKGPVTSMCHCNGYLLTGMGQKIFIWQFRDGVLNGISFLDVHFYVHNLVGFRSLALACDMFKSVSLIRFQEEHKVLSLVSKDLRPFTPSPMSAQFLLDKQHLVFVLSDENGNVSIFSYMPEASESHGGEHLVLLGSLNIGSASNGIVRVNGHANGPFLESTDSIREVQTNILSTLDGSWAVLRPINERAFRRLQILQQLMVSQVPQSAGLNPRGCRAAKPQKLLQQPKSSNRAIIDGNFVFQFMNLSTATKSELARASGSNRYQIMDDITEFHRACTHF